MPRRLAITIKLTAIFCLLMVLSGRALCIPPWAPWNAVTRDLGKASKPGGAALLESHRQTGSNYGCSFIEFDGRGGFLNYGQLDQSVTKLRVLSGKSPVLLVIYCHGWQNNAQSGDVLNFIGFLRQLANTEQMRHVRVQGVYLGWRGSEYMPVIGTDPATRQLRQTLSDDFGGDVLDTKWQDPLPGPVIALPKVLSYWSIKSRAEFYVSRVPLARAVFQLAYAVKAPSAAARNHVFVLGHSFGALLLEQAIGQGSVGLVESEWDAPLTGRRWPFDLIVFMNSAAPSIYAKQLYELLEQDTKISKRPRIVSITSTADDATGIAHPIGNYASLYAADLQRKYHPFATPGDRRSDQTTVTAGYFYDRTPGHNPILVTQEIKEATGVQKPNLHNHDEVFGRNIAKTSQPTNMFYTWDGKSVRTWKVDRVDDEKRKERNRGHLPHFYPSNYWIVQENGALIHGHSDIWNPQCLEMLAGVYRMVMSQPQ